MNQQKEQEFIEKLATRIDANYVTGSDLEPFRQAVEPVYQYYVDRGELTWEEVARARRAARGE